MIEPTHVAGNDHSLAAVVRGAGFWVRFFAGMIDLAILAVPFAVFVSFLASGMGMAKDFLELHPGEAPSAILTRFGPRFLFLSLCFFAASSWLYFAFSESSSWRASLGKRLLGLYVGGNDGRRVRFWQASARFVSGRLLIHVPVVGGYYFILDCLCIAVLPENRALHDLASGCRVLREGATRPVFNSFEFRTPDH
ncbi:MAG: RDD family protein [Candidatus Acidiferrum sp.]